MRVTFLRLVMLLLVVLNMSSVFAVTNGQLDNNNHPAVVLIVMDINGYPAYRCSGVLISPTYVLTAGHCAGEPGEFSGMRVFTEADVENGDNNYPFAGNNSIEAVRWASHPLYNSASFFLHDVGMLQLQHPYKLPPQQYAALPVANILDELARQRGLQDVSFTAVGYGLQEINPVFVERAKIRMFATPNLIQINVPGFTGDFSLLLSNNHATGGTCFGDSGGPNFIGSGMTVGGVTSFGINSNCAGTGGVFRIDRQDVLNFINSFTNP